MSLLASPFPVHLPSILPKIVPHFILRRAEAANQRLWSLKIPVLHSTSAAEAASQLLEDEVVALQEAADAQLEETSNGTEPSAALAKRRTQNRRVNIIALDAVSGEGVAAIEAALTANSTTSSSSQTQSSSTSLPPPSSETLSETQPLLQPTEPQSQPQRHPNPPALVKLTSTHPDTYLDTWISISSHSDNLSFLPQAIDPASTTPLPASVTSRASTASQQAASHDSSSKSTSPPTTKSSTSSALTIWLFISDFHLISPQRRQQSLKNALGHSSTFTLLSHTDRRLSTLLVVLLFRFWVVWAECVLGCLWHRDVLTVLGSFPVPVVPVLATWVGLKECLGGMTFRETMACVDGALGFSAADAQERRRRWCDDHLVDGRESAERAGWRFEGRRVRYRWPYGWATAFVGRRVEGRDRLR